ncbi:hypothetical protein VP01_706g1 [Puccinia sorghi]|uniref:Uncharacterized protein n=1 Tax=Puccinia sorghi TaxID=27349 RepID=A0A0L6UDP0_9BASI|nr:hypothetical protein VP01_706g1 [Puccinia sorghi]
MESMFTQLQNSVVNLLENSDSPQKIITNFVKQPIVVHNNHNPGSNWPTMDTTSPPYRRKKTSISVLGYSMATTSLYVQITQDQAQSLRPETQIFYCCQIVQTHDGSGNEIMLGRWSHISAQIPAKRICGQAHGTPNKTILHFPDWLHPTKKITNPCPQMDLYSIYTICQGSQRYAPPHRCETGNNPHEKQDTHGGLSLHKATSGNWYNNCSAYCEDVRREIFDAPPEDFDSPKSNYLWPARPS